MVSRDDSGRVEKTAHRYAGYDAYDSKGEKVGYVDDLFIDRVNGQEYIELNMGFLGMKSTVIPMEVCEVDDQRMVINISQSRTKVRKAPRKKSPLIGDDVMAITPDYEDRVRKYFRLEEIQPAANERTFSVYSQAYASKEEPAGGDEAEALPAKPRVRRRRVTQESAAVEPQTPEPEMAEQPGSVEPEPVGEPAALEPETVEVPPEITPESVEVPTPIEFEPVTEPTAIEPEPVEAPVDVEPEPVEPEPVEPPAVVEPEPVEQPTAIEPETVEQATAAEGMDDVQQAEEPEGEEADRVTPSEELIPAGAAGETVAQAEAAESAPVQDQEPATAVARATGPDETYQAEETERVAAGLVGEPAQASTGGSVTHEESGEGVAVQGSTDPGQVRESRRAPHGLQQQAMQAMVQGSVNAYANLMGSAFLPILLYQQNLMIATQVALGGVRATTRAATGRNVQSSR